MSPDEYYTQRTLLIAIKKEKEKALADYTHWASCYDDKKATRRRRIELIMDSASNYRLEELPSDFYEFLEAILTDKVKEAERAVNTLDEEYKSGR